MWPRLSQPGTGHLQGAEERRRTGTRGEERRGDGEEVLKPGRKEGNKESEKAQGLDKDNPKIQTVEKDENIIMKI